MIKPFYLACAAAILLSCANAGSAMAQMPAATPYTDMPAGTYSVDKHHAFVLWKVKHTILSTYVGRFTRFDSDIVFNPTDIAKSRVTASIDPTSLETDYVSDDKKDFNKELSEGENWFNAKKFPSITFQSNRIEITGKTTARIHGDLTLLGVTKPVVLNTTFNGAYKDQPFSHKPTLGFAAHAVIKRSEWGLSTYVPMIGDDVELEIHGEFAKQN